MNKQFAVLVILLIPAIMFAAILQVPEQYNSIQSAINNAEDGDTVLAAPGRYTENLVVEHKPITLAGHFLLTGNPDQINQTVIDGSANGSVILFRDIEDASLQLYGLTIQNGSGSVLEDRMEYLAGGGVFCRNATPAIQHCHFRNNTALEEGQFTYGGALLFWNDDTLDSRLSDCVFERNEAAFGGAVYSFKHNLMINNCEFRANEAEYNGGALAIEYSNASEIQNSHFHYNTARWGAGIDFSRTRFSRLFRVSITDNFLSENGAVHIDESYVNFIHTTIAGNRNPDQNCYGVYGMGGSYVNIVNSIVQGDEYAYYHTSEWCVNRLIVSHSNILGEVYCLNMEGWNLNGNINVDPRFSDPQNGDYTLGDFTACVDGGRTYFEAYNDILLDLSPEEYNGRAPDMGAFEMIYDDVPGNSDKPEDYGLIDVFPNPFNSSTRVSYTLPTPGNITLSIYNTRGQLVDVLADRVVPAGRHSVVWETDDASAGVYLVRMMDKGGRMRNVRKVVLVK